MPDVILPCLDEALALPWVLSRLPAGYRAIVADNGSCDGSARIARDHGAIVIDVPQRGYGAACHAGLLACDPPDGVVCFLDADGTLDPEQLPVVAAPVVAGDIDLMLGRRRPAAPGAWPLHARLANGVLAARLRQRLGVRLHDIGPMRAARATALRRLGVSDRRFGYPIETVLKAAAADWRIDEAPVRYLPRVAGARSKVTGTVLGTARAARDIRRVMRG